MPVFTVSSKNYAIPRNIALLDANVLIALFDGSDEQHDWTRAVIEDGPDYYWGVSYPAIVEAWNFLVGRQKNRSAAINLMGWLLTPGQVVLLDEQCDDLGRPHAMSQTYKIDLVDACLINTAMRLTDACDLVPAVHVATYDTGDFLRCFGLMAANFNVLDMRHLTSTATG